MDLNELKNLNLQDIKNYKHGKSEKLCVCVCVEDIYMELKVRES